MKNMFVWVIIIVVLAAGFYWFLNIPEEEASVAPQDVQEEEMPQSLVVALSSQNDSGMSGVALLTSVNGSTFVELNLTGAPVDIAQPAHIHTGSCADIGGVVYPLESPVNGVSETLLDVSLEVILADLPLALNVHQSVAEADIYVACGDLTN